MNYRIFRIVILLIFQLLCLQSFSQINQKDSAITDLADIKWALINNYQPNVDSVNNSCWKGCVFIRFNVRKHQLINVSYTANTPVFILGAVSKAISKINQKGGINIPSLTKEGNKTYIQPFIITNNEGCGFKSGWESDTLNKLSEKQKLMYEQRQGDYDQLQSSIENITNFIDGKKLEMVDCILLAPVVMPVAMH
ncbi:hypothetical protein [Mucilaginibacter phyllosphaerae]